MNRFASIDHRGTRKILETPVFALDSYSRLKDDPLFPYGFQKGFTKIDSLTDTNNRPIPFSIENNPDLPVGYSTEHGLLRVSLEEAIPENTLVFEFTTKLPVRFQDGLVFKELMVVEWHPVLLSYKHGTWIKDMMEPSPGIYEVMWTADTTGLLITSAGDLEYGQARQHVKLEQVQPLKYFPLIFSPNYSRLNTGHPVIESYYFSEDLRRAQLLQIWGEEFLDYMASEFDLKQPWDKIRIVEVRGNYEDIRVVNNLILVTIPHYKRSTFMDRRVLGFFSRGMAELWFGEKVWANEDTQLWLHMGLPAFFSLKFFEYKYGLDARIFDFFDWLNPHYREHFFESMVRGVNPALEVPIMSKISKLSDYRVYLKFATYKTALVFSMLQYLTGNAAFRKGLRHFFENNQYQVVTLKDIHQSMEQMYPEPLDWFFLQWFYTTDTMDYGIREFTYDELPAGGYEVRVVIEKKDKGQMPVDVVIETEDEQVIHKRALGNQDIEMIRFITVSPPVSISLDPDEILLETDRQNNQSFHYFRVRFAFDWQKNREILITLVPRGSSNAFDGNHIGLETRHVIGDYIYNVTPGYGTKNEQLTYQSSVERRNLLGIKGFVANVNLSRIGGILSKGVGLLYSSPQHQEKYSYNYAVNLAQQAAFKARKTSSGISSDIIETGDTSNISISHTSNIGFGNIYYLEFNLGFEKPVLALGSDFDYTLWTAKIQHAIKTGFRKRIDWEWIGGTTQGTSPLQKHHQLGSPTVLRGYPQRTILRDENLLAMRCDFSFPVISSQWWGDISSLGVLGGIFYDMGKVWGNDVNPADVPLRQDVGVGLVWNINAVSLAEAPLKIEVAYPLNDPEFTKPQLILFEVLSIF
ncbi:MAG: BamA/TamA family outer membrane protein [SAR324 cluster bacterium]|nr:BamA/TamA family outer membrane protein [SAR324 cluster bacterium]